MFKKFLLVTAAAMSCVSYGQASSFDSGEEDTLPASPQTQLNPPRKGEELNPINPPNDYNSDSDYFYEYSDSDSESVEDEDGNSSANKNTTSKNIIDMSNDEAEEYVKKKNTTNKTHHT